MIGRLLRGVFGASKPASGAGARSDANTRFEFGRVHKETLSGALSELVGWPAAADPEAPAGELFEQWLRLPGGNKLHHYFPVYERTFGPLRQRPVRVLEIGVFQGASLKMWRQYFHPGTCIVGIDIDPRCRRYEDAANGVHVRIGSQADEAFLRSVVAEFGRFDLIIDDGSHRCADMLASFNFLFLEGLKDEAIYFVEDTHSNYYQGFRNTEFSFLDMAKALVDVMHAHYVEDDEHPSKLHAFALNHAQRLPLLDVPRITTLLEEIRFHDSIVVFHRKPKPALPLSHHT